MLIDLSLHITPQLNPESPAQAKLISMGHLGTHFDVMNKQFPLNYTRLPALIFDIRDLGPEVAADAVDLTAVKPGTFVGFCAGASSRAPYGSPEYAAEHPQLSYELIDALLERNVAIIGVDFAGIRRGPEHTPADQRCADRGTFVVENLWALETLLTGGSPASCTINTYPVSFLGLTGLPCRVVAEVADVAVLRPAQPEDAGALSALAALSEAHWGYDDAFMARFRQLYRVTEDHISVNPTFILEEDNRLLGFFSLLTDRHPAELEYFYVTSAEIGRGLGRELWEHLVRYCRRTGISDLEWVTSPQAEAFYLHMGAERCGEVPSSIDGRPLPKLRFRPAPQTRP